MDNCGDGIKKRFKVQGSRFRFRVQRFNGKASGIRHYASGKGPMIAGLR
jgi:hypothetical protein